MHTIHFTEDADELWHSADSDETNDDYAYKEEWVAGPETKWEDLPPGQPFGRDAALVPGFVRKVYRIKKSALKKKRAQLAQLDHELMVAFNYNKMK